ncbi:phosphoenolpyruvate carboxykinase (ATP) [Mucilaginibacter achroorhodeus]|uniref:Phosphoenolpyruvate carboxykinase (ATP) n=1 Tax=Mucilaginibacter achroorhodeus TaxID=2599294 RepID=A0A563TXR8_9SPHI|nr:phosphoenolpyruvate carboxykinase (ATP) [Mucilaginibacter achroorhodeus]TWR24134.1 phosphoenolpyruvate carboxykinase (ATP) [Mucilaginibacter achroorhodeus]
MKSVSTLTSPLADLGLQQSNIFYQLSPDELIASALQRKEGVLSDTGALAIDTGTFTGRSPKDRFIVDDHITHDNVWWSKVNYKMDGAHFKGLHKKMIAYLNGRDLFVRDSAVCADEKYRMNVRVITETAYQNLFACHLFMCPEANGINDEPEWTVIAAPGFEANPETDGTRQKNFTVISFSKRTILIGGTGYTGEIKKGIFSVLNFVLPHYYNVLPMHCSANVGADGDTAIFFGLSGTGKTTLSADPNRMLIGDDEHGWSNDSIFNFEGGCYAKCVGLTAEKEPQIFNAIKQGALLENINFFEGTDKVDFDNIAKTENTRVAYPVNYISNALIPSIGKAPKNIFFLTADAFGVLPPIAKLTAEQAMYYFISGYTAKVAGTEAGINEPVTTFSACFGEAFLPLNPVKYAELLGNKIEQQQVNVWLINTGWTGGPYGTGSRISLTYTRAMINAVLNGELDDVSYNTDPIFNLKIPAACPNIPAEILQPANTWADKESYERQANNLALAFVNNFEKYTATSPINLIKAGPNIVSAVF